MFGKNKQKEAHGAQALDEALAAWREAEGILPAERLSAGARANIRVLSRENAPAEPARPLNGPFVPLGRLVAAAGVPAVLLAVTFAWLIGGGGEDLRAAGETALSIEARKVNGEAVFDIANGGRIHRVYKADSARDLAHAELFTTTAGSFSDTIEGESGVVFYRIE